MPEQQQHRREGALQMALPDYDDEGPPPLNVTLRETARLSTPAHQRAMSMVREALGLAPQRITPNESMGPYSSALMAHRRAVHRIREGAAAHRQRALDPALPAPAPLPVHHVRLAHVPRNHNQSPVDAASAMMRTWVLVDEEEQVPPPPLPKHDFGVEPRPPLARGVCCVCMDERRPCEVVFTGCGHMNTCLGCAQKLQENSDNAIPCPLCRIKSRPLLVRVG